MSLLMTVMHRSQTNKNN